MTLRPRKIFSQDRIFDVLAMAACAGALIVALQTVRGLQWPYDGDHYRDVAAAQAARDGHPLSDPHYPGEWVWYNPLVPWIVAAGSSIARVTPAEFHAQGGPWLNLLAPIGFYLLGIRLAGRGAAFAALVIFLFFNCRTDPALVCPTYSPWLFVATFAQGLFYLALLAIVRAREEAHPADRLRRGYGGPPKLRAKVDAGSDRGPEATTRKLTDAGSAVVGVLAGLTFLAHAGPAVVLGVIAIFLLPGRSLLVAGGVALAVASPFLYAIVWHYGLDVVNPVPMVWPWLPVTLAGFPATLRMNAALIVAGLAGAFFVTHRVARVWLIVSLGLTSYGLGRELAPALPAIVPVFHFWRYAMAALTLLAGATVWKLCERSAGRHAVRVAAATALVAVALYFPQYRSRFDNVYGQSIARDRPAWHAQVTAFLRKSTPADAVVLGSRGASLQIIGPAGRHVVAVNANWSNPYIENAGRVADREAMIEALKTRDEARFTQLADAYRVTHVVGVGADQCDAMKGSMLHLLFEFDDVCVFSR